jgi:hypothetical protein
MNIATARIDVSNLAKAFEKIGKSFKGKHLDELNFITHQQFSKIIPSENSEVLLAGGYSPDDQTLGLNVYVSNPKKNPQPDDLRFEKFMFELLIRADINKLNVLKESLDLMKFDGTENYKIDGIPVHYNEELGDYYMYFVIKKE